MLTLRQFQPIDVQPILSGGRFASLETQDGQAAHDTSTANRAATPNGDILRIIYLVMKKSLDSAAAQSLTASSATSTCG
jgi:hypothetical protein